MSNGFPSGCFVIKSIGSQRVLDVQGKGTADGNPVIAYPELESSWVEGFRNPIHDNQVFFIDETGALCSKASGHAIDIQDGFLVLRRRRPMTQPFPNEYSHPLPRFQYFPSTGYISVLFSADPNSLLSRNTGQMNPTSSPVDWRSKRYIVTCLPKRAERTFVDDAADFLSNTATTIATPFTRLFSPASPTLSPVTADDVAEGQIELRVDETLDIDRAPHEELDDSPDPVRIVKLIELYGKEDETDQRLNEKARSKRQWQVIPILKAKMRTRNETS